MPFLMRFIVSFLFFLLLISVTSVGLSQENLSVCSDGSCKVQQVLKGTVLFERIVRNGKVISYQKAPTLSRDDLSQACTRGCRKIKRGGYVIHTRNGRIVSASKTASLGSRPGEIEIVPRKDTSPSRSATSSGSRPGEIEIVPRKDTSPSRSATSSGSRPGEIEIVPRKDTSPKESPEPSEEVAIPTPPTPSPHPEKVFKESVTDIVPDTRAALAPIEEGSTPTQGASSSTINDIPAPKLHTSNTIEAAIPPSLPSRENSSEEEVGIIDKIFGKLASIYSAVNSTITRKGEVNKDADTTAAVCVDCAATSRVKEVSLNYPSLYLGCSYQGVIGTKFRNKEDCKGAISNIIKACADGYYQESASDKHLFLPKNQVNDKRKKIEEYVSTLNKNSNFSVSSQVMHCLSTKENSKHDPFLNTAFACENPKNIQSAFGLFQVTRDYLVDAIRDKGFVDSLKKNGLCADSAKFSCTPCSQIDDHESECFKRWHNAYMSNPEIQIEAARWGLVELKLRQTIQSIFKDSKKASCAVDLYKKDKSKSYRKYMDYIALQGYYGNKSKVANQKYAREVMGCSELKIFDDNGDQVKRFKEDMKNECGVTEWKSNSAIAVLPGTGTDSNSAAVLEDAKNILNGINFEPKIQMTEVM